MKLSTDSMDKLFDLVVMGVKYQVMSVQHPCELIDVTLNHIDYIAKLGKQSSTTADAMEKGRTAFVEFARNLRASEYAQVRQALLDFSIRKRVKVSLFLQEKMQHHDGRFVINAGGPLPNEETVKTPGSIRYEDGTSDAFSYPLASELRPKLTGNPYDSETRDSTLGQNFYTVDRKKPQSPAQAEPAKAAAPRHGTSGSATAASSAKGEFCAGAAELNALGTLLGVSAEKPSAQYFRVSLFDEAQDSGGAPAGSAANTEVITIPRMQREELQKCNPELCSVMAGMDISGGQDGKTDDLADLMDMAGQ
eukprot:TRINITY_DN4729_c0_g2_i1.p1 TRINITY_DN4729_c0_g2~~TRINITY_DN4729_c0_g2_i1.p1  ORF type:complete len:307 (+),score=103.41 TRINITY_DN4729_c0_g2_i1:642-1562(+)